MFALQIKSIFDHTKPYVMDIEGELLGILEELASLQEGSEEFNSIRSRPRVRMPKISSLSSHVSDGQIQTFFVATNLGR